MAITAYTGPPGAGKSHAMVKEVIVPAVMAGRRVVSNIDGLNADAILAYCLEREREWKVDHADKLGEVLTFHGEDAQAAGFWPTETTERAGEVTFIRPGDLVVFDEWAMFFPAGGRTDTAQRVEDFMRWHRHMTADSGHATDLAIGTQSISDFHRRHRPLISNSYNFKKLTAVGAKGSYTWHAFNGRLQKNSYLTGSGKYDSAIFPLYKSSAAAGAGNHTELQTNRKETIWSGSKAWVAIGLPILLIAGGVFGLYRVFGTEREPLRVGGPSRATPSQAVAVAPQYDRPSTNWRIVGHIDGHGGKRVVVADTAGNVRTLAHNAFEFDQGRPISGRVDGELVIAQDGLSAAAARSSPFGGGAQ